LLNAAPFDLVPSPARAWEKPDGRSNDGGKQRTSYD